MADVDISGLDQVLGMLQKLPREVVAKRGGPVLKHLKIGARLIHQQLQANLRGTLQGSDDAESTGLLLKSSIVSRGKPPTEGKGERVLVRFKRRRYENRKGKVVTTLKTAQLKEYGSSQQSAEPFIRPAFSAKAGEAIRTIETGLAAEVVAIAERLGK